MRRGIHMIPGAQQTAQEFQFPVYRVLFISRPHAAIIE
jgi:hypothetical protein